MGATLILYGSRARGEVHPHSDVDLILAEDGMSLRTPRSQSGISVHLYSKEWLVREAEQGSLFTYHVAHEGVALQDNDGFLLRLRQAFHQKHSYRVEIETAALVIKMLLEQDWRDNLEARRRYFWALRTVIISSAADQDFFIFASTALETYTNIEGLASHIDGREGATFEACKAFGSKALQVAGEISALSGEPLRDHLIGLGGIARDSVRIVEEREAIETGGLAIYM
jgi:Nucleotidyltransferase domain